MQEKEWFFARNNKQEGPLSENEIKKLLASGALSPETLVWSDGMPNWQPASTVQTLVVVSKKAPPPLPLQSAHSGFNPHPGPGAGPGLIAPPYNSLQNQDRFESADELLRPHPWHRYFARFIDNGLATIVSLIVFAILGVFIQKVVFGDNMPRDGRIPSYIAMMFFYATTNMIMEPLILGLAGTTLGKLIFNIRLRKADTSGKIGIFDAIKRTFLVFLRGGGIILACPAPVINFLAWIFMLVHQYKTLTQTGSTSWDREMNLRYEHRPMTTPRWITCGILIFITALASGFAAWVLVSFTMFVFHD